MEEAEGYRNLIKDHGLTQEDLAQKIGKSQSTTPQNTPVKACAHGQKMLQDQ